MANKHKGEVSWQIGEETYTLRLSVNEFCLLEDALGKPIKQILTELEDIDNLKMSNLRVIVHSALKVSHPEITIEQAGNMMSAFGPAETVAKLTEALIASFPEAKVAEKNPK